MTISEAISINCRGSSGIAVSRPCLSNHYIKGLQGFVPLRALHALSHADLTRFGSPAPDRDGTDNAGVGWLRTGRDVAGALDSLPLGHVGDVPAILARYRRRIRADTPPKLLTDELRRAH